MKIPPVARTAFALALSVAVLAGLAYVLDAARLAEALRGMDLYFFGLALAMVPAFVGLKAYKWHYLVLTRARVAFGDSVASYLAGNSISILTPSRTGELARAIYLPVAAREEMAGLAALDKVFDLLGLLLMSCVGTTLVFGLPAAVLLLAASAAVIAGIFNLRLLSRFISGNRLLSSSRRLVSLGEALVMRKETILATLGLTLLIFAVVLAQCYCLVRAFAPVSPEAVFFAFPLAMLTNAIPLTIAGLGIREGTAVVLLAMFGVAGPAAFNSAFLLFFVNTFLPGLAGVPVILWKHARPGKHSLFADPDPDREEAPKVRL